VEARQLSARTGRVVATVDIGSPVPPVPPGPRCRQAASSGPHGLDASGAAAHRGVVTTYGLAAQDGLDWWRDRVRRCPECGGRGVQVVLEVTDRDTADAIGARLACLGDCCIDGLGGDHECLRCGHRFD
jgi:hypothetical protein